MAWKGHRRGIVKEFRTEKLKKTVSGRKEWIIVFDATEKSRRSKKKNRIEYLMDKNSEALRHKSMIIKNGEEDTGGAALDYSFKKFNF